MSEVAEAAERAGRQPADVRVVAVAKGHSVATVAAAASAGISRIGESRVQEALPKIAALPAVEWHLVGRLQPNKARRAVRAFRYIHSVESLALLDRLDRLAGEEDAAAELLMQVNVSGEESKAGIAADWLDCSRGCEALASALHALHHVRVTGLMTIAPLSVIHAAARPHFRRLRELRDRLEQATGAALPELSMGMSVDYREAIAEGATLVRIGTAIFGERPAREART